MRLKSRNPQTSYTILEAKFLSREEYSEKMVCLFNYIPCTTTNASPKLVSAFLRSFTCHGQAAVAVILRDVTEQSLILSLKIVDVQKDMMLAMVSHELRMPLMGFWL